VTSPRDVCRWAGFDENICDSSDGKATTIVEPLIFRNISSSPDTSAPHDADKTHLSWSDLDVEDSLLSTEVSADQLLTRNDGGIHTYIDQDHVLGIRV